MDQREVTEAIEAGERLLYKLDQARNQLQSAKGWGLFDMLGGGFLSTFIKRDKMKQAESLMKEVNQYATAFKKEVADIHLPLDLELTNDSFLGFADYFFDNFFVDFMVQSKITNGIRKIEDYQSKVEKALNKIKEYRTY